MCKYAANFEGTAYLAENDKEYEQKLQHGDVVLGKNRRFQKSVFGTHKKSSLSDTPTPQGTKPTFV